MTSYFGNNGFKFGLFGLNCGGGVTPSRAPERWRAEWDDVERATLMAEAAGVEFVLPIAKWHGLGGAADLWGRSFETFTQSAALGAITKKIGVFVTAHVSLLTPAFVAKAISTIDHVTHGRVGLNIVCGWNPDEFSLHGISLTGERRYERGIEWYRIYDRLLKGEKFDWKSEFYEMRGLCTDPLPVQKRPPVMSAAQSGDGQAFAAEVADILFSTMPGYAQVEDTCRRVKALGAQHGRTPEVYVTTQFVCRRTKKEAEEYAHYYAVEMADTETMEYLKRQKSATVSPSMKLGATAADRATATMLAGGRHHDYPGLLPSNFPIIGSPDDIVAEIQKLSSLGVSGSTLIFLNYLDEMPFFFEEVFPRLERVGLRAPIVSHAVA